MMTTCTLLILTIFSLVSSEEMNLHGLPLKGYAIQILIGKPPQKLNVLLDTGSSTLCVASKPRYDINAYFDVENSSTVYRTGYQVQAEFTVGGFIGDLVEDYVQIPSLPSVPEVKTDIALITSAHKFFMNNSDWEGILGLGYYNGGARGPNSIAKPWMYSLDAALGKPMSFKLKLCGVRSQLNASHYGSFKILDETTSRPNTNMTYHTPILREIWFEVGVISIHVVESIVNRTPDMKTCAALNAVKTVVDSGTTNLRIADPIFSEVVTALRAAAKDLNISLPDAFWSEQKFECWSKPQTWSEMPRLAIDLLSTNDPHQYFTIQLPPESYMHLVPSISRNGTTQSGQFCYFFGLERGFNTTILGVSALEGLEVTFNKSHSYISFQTSSCGPNVSITGPYNATQNLIDFCALHKFIPDTQAESIKIAQWTSIFALCIAMVLLTVFLTPPCLRSKCAWKTTRRESHLPLTPSIVVDDNG